MAYTSPNRPSPTLNIPVVCIDDSGRPSDVPLSKWVKKGNRYTIVGQSYMVSYGVYGVFLKEIDLSGCGIYKNFLSTRFADALDSLHSRMDELLEEAAREYHEEFEPVEK